MRPRKVVLVCDGDERRRATRSLVLDVRGGFRVMPLASAAECLELLSALPAWSAEVLVAELQQGEDALAGAELCRVVRERYPWLRTLLVSATLDGEWPECEADGFLSKGRSSGEALVDRVRLLAYRRRGPRRVVREEAVCA